MSDKHKENEFVFTGVQLLNLEIVEKVKKKKFSLKEIFDQTLRNGRLYGLVDSNKWFHLGTLKDLEVAKKII